MTPDYNAGYQQSTVDMIRECKAQLTLAQGTGHEPALRWLLTVLRTRLKTHRQRSKQGMTEVSLNPFPVFGYAAMGVYEHFDQGLEYTVCHVVCATYAEAHEACVELVDGDTSVDARMLRANICKTLLRFWHKDM